MHARDIYMKTFFFHSYRPTDFQEKLELVVHCKPYSYALK